MSDNKNINNLDDALEISVDEDLFDYTELELDEVSSANETFDDLQDADDTPAEEILIDLDEADEITEDPFNFDEYDRQVQEMAGNDDATNVEEPVDFDENFLADTPAVAVSATSDGRGWLIIALTSLALILLVTLFISPMVAYQKGRITATNDIARDIEASNLYAAQALTDIGRYQPLIDSLKSAQNSVNSLVAPSSIVAQMGNGFFGNTSDNNSVDNLWAEYKTISDQFLSHEEKVTEIKEKIVGFDGQLNQIVSTSVKFVEAVAKEGRNNTAGLSKDKYLFLTSEASNLNGILSRLASTVRTYFLPNQDLDMLTDIQNGLIVRLKDTLNRVVTNTSAVVQTASEPLVNEYNELEARALEIGDLTGALTDSREALSQLRTKSTELLTATNSAQNQSGLVQFLSNMIGILPLLLGLFAAFALWRYAQTRSIAPSASDGVASETLAEQQESILRLLDEMSALADGDLTVEAEVTDQITGAIADSVNFAVAEMRELVSQINRASIEVANESEQAVNNAQQVSRSNISQAEEISTAANLMQDVSLSMRKMSQQANSSSKMAEESIKAAEQGAQAVRDTIEGMEGMREQIQETSKRIKRLGESSQSIGDIVALIDDIAEQTNILSLNAAIQASMAGEAGRGFAVVSDEVQSLAERSTEATRKIGELVTTIQNDTNAAVLSMEKVTQQVVSGTRVADSAGNALSEIENVSKSLSQLVESISKDSSNQAEVVTKVSEQVSEVSGSSTDTSRKAQDSANSIAKLLELAKELESSVSRFKLPAAS